MTDPAIDGAAEPSLSQSDLTTTGRRLAAARESLGLSVADVARQIKLSVHQVEALEADDFGHLPKSPVIVKGFLRNYARLVHLDPEQLLAGVHGLPGASPEPKGRRRQREVISFERPSHPWLKMLLGGLLFVAVMLGIYEYSVDPDFFRAPETITPTAERPAPAPAGSAAPQKATAETPPALTAAPSEGPGAAAIGAAGAEPTAAASAVLASPSTAAAASGPGIVRFRVERDSWIEIKDRDGNKILNQLVKAGSEKSVQGIAPLHLVVGAASGVKVEWNDQPVNIVPFTKVDVAKFTLE